MPKYIHSKEEQGYYAQKWCKSHNATVICTSTYGFCYMLDNGNTYTIDWCEI